MKYLLFYMKVINISEVSEEVVLAKKAPKKNNDARQHPSPCLSNLAKKNVLLPINAGIGR